MSKTKETNTVENNDANSALKTFKTSSEVQDFYRFIHENNIREEAYQLMKIVLKSITPQKKRGRKKTTLQ